MFEGPKPDGFSTYEGTFGRPGEPGQWRETVYVYTSDAGFKYEVMIGPSGNFLFRHGPHAGHEFTLWGFSLLSGHQWVIRHFDLTAEGGRPI